MKMSLVFDPDPDLGHDPKDDAKEPRALGLFIDTDREDVLLIHRRYGEQYEFGVRTDIYSSGIFENVDLDRVSEAIGHIEGLSE